MKLFLSAVVGYATLILAACSGSSEPTANPAGASLERAESVSTHGVDPASLLGTWAFVLDESDVASKVRQRCSATSAGDAARAESCYAEVRAEGASEKVRFASGPDGHTEWTSFGDKGGAIELFLKVSMDLSSEGATRVAGTIAGAPTGAQADGVREKMPIGTVVHFDKVDARTLAMVDPVKGRLVYHRE